MLAIRNYLRALTLVGLVLIASMVSADGGIPVWTLSGEPQTLEKFIAPGKWNLVMVWTTYCQVCRKQYPMVSAFHRRHADDNAVVLGVSLDGKAQIAKVADYRVHQAHSFPSVVADPESFPDKYASITGVTFTGTPTYLLIDPHGALRGYLDGPIEAETIEKYIAN